MDAHRKHNLHSIKCQAARVHIVLDLQHKYVHLSFSNFIFLVQILQPTSLKWLLQAGLPTERDQVMSSRTFRLERAVLFQKRHHMATGNWLSSAHRRRRQIPMAFPWNLRDLHSVSFPTIPDSDILSDGALWFTSALSFPSVPPFSLTWCARADATTTGVMALLTRPRTLVISLHQPTRTRQDSKHFSTYLYFYLRVFKSSSMYIG